MRMSNTLKTPSPKRKTSCMPITNCWLFRSLQQLLWVKLAIPSELSLARGSRCKVYRQCTLNSMPVPEVSADLDGCPAKGQDSASCGLQFETTLWSWKEVKTNKSISKGSFTSVMNVIIICWSWHDWVGWTMAPNTLEMSSQAHILNCSKLIPTL